MKKIAFFLIFGMFALGSHAVTSVFLSGGEFSEILKTKKNVVVVDCDRAANYATSHVKGAINIWQQDIFVKDGPEGIMKSPEELAKFFGSKGISEQTPVILYDDGSNKYTSRIWYVLTYLGAVDVRIVSRISTEWEKFRIPMTSTPVKLAAAKFIATPKPSMFISLSDYKSLSGVRLIDTRNAEEFVGADKEKKSNGHLPGALNISHKEFLNGDGSFKSVEDLTKLATQYQLQADQDIVVYCYSGVRAAVGYLALKEVLGFQKVRVLEGGYNHWVLDPANKLEK